MIRPDRLNPKGPDDLHNYDPDTRAIWEIFTEHWQAALIGAFIGAFVMFPVLRIVMTALAIIAEAAQ